jgi:hypothetical protein
VDSVRENSLCFLFSPQRPWRHRSRRWASGHHHSARAMLSCAASCRRSRCPIASPSTRTYSLRPTKTVVDGSKPCSSSPQAYGWLAFSPRRVLPRFVNPRIGNKPPRFSI